MLRSVRRLFSIVEETELFTELGVRAGVGGVGTVAGDASPPLVVAAVAAETGLVFSLLLALAVLLLELFKHMSMSFCVGPLTLLRAESW